MSEPRLRRRALIATAAVAGTIGLAFAGIAPASAATPVGSFGATTASSSAVAPTAAAHASLLHGRVADVLKNAPYGTFGSTAARTRAAKALAAATGSTARAASPSVSPTLPTAVVPPAKVDPNSNPDSAYVQASVGDELYGVGGSWLTDHTYLEHYTETGWKPVDGIPVDIDDTIAAVGDTLYYSVTTYSRNYVPTVVLYAFDGQTSTAVKTFDGDISLATDGTDLTVLKDVQPTSTDEDDFDFSDDFTSTTAISTFDGSTWSTPFTTTKYIFAPLTVAGAQYFWVMSETSDATALYRLDAGKLTRISSSPLAFSATTWNGATYFGGVDTTKGFTGVYRFDGTSAPTKVGVGVAATYSSDIPAVGTYDGDLVYTTQTPGKAPMLWNYDNHAVTKIGAIGDPDDELAYFTEAGGKLYAAAGGGWTVDTWIYDQNATTGNPITTDVPTISGKVVVGKYLEAVAGNWAPPTAKLSYQWLRNGTPITGATKSYHQLGSSDYKKKISVRVTGSGPAFVTSAPQTSAQTEAAAIGTIGLYVDTYGRAQEGRTVTADIYTNQKSATFTYRWYLNGKPIAGATKSKFTITSGMAGKKLTLGVRASKTGFADASKMSDARTIAKK